MLSPAVVADMRSAFRGTVKLMRSLSVCLFAAAVGLAVAGARVSADSSSASLTVSVVVHPSCRVATNDRRGGQNTDLIVRCSGGAETTARAGLDRQVLPVSVVDGVPSITASPNSLIDIEF